MPEIRFDFVRCPDCHGALGSEEGRALVCQHCSNRYPIVDGIPQLVGGKSAINTSEVETQDYVTDFYENLRYKLPWARAYHEHTLQQMLVEMACSWSGSHARVYRAPNWLVPTSAGGCLPMLDVD
jgi:uncharacterized protein YbaR (Trm112 family)